MAQETTAAASFGETLLLQKGEKQKLLHCQKGAKNDRNKVNTTRLTSRLPRSDPKMAKETTSAASYGETLLLQKGEKQKLLQLQNKVSKDRDHKLRFQCRIYKNVTHIWHRRQQLLLPLGKYYCSIKARSRNSFTVRMELDMKKTQSTILTSRLQRRDPQTAQDTMFPASFVEILLLHKGERQKLLHFQNKVSKDRDHKLRVQCRNYKHMTHKWHRRQRLLLPMGKHYCSKKARSRNSFQKGAKNDRNKVNTTRLTSRLQRSDPKMAKETTYHASSGEILLLHKGEKQKLLHFENKVSKERDRKLRVQCRIYKHVTYKWHRRQRLLLTMGKYYCSIKARSRNSSTVRMELDTTETKSTILTSRIQRCDPQTAQDTMFPASFVEILLLHKGERQKLLHFQNKVSKDRDHKLRVQCRIYKHMTHKWHRRQRLLLPMGKHYCSKKARSRNSFTVRKELKTIGTKSTQHV